MKNSFLANAASAVKNLFLVLFATATFFLLPQIVNAADTASTEAQKALVTYFDAASSSDALFRVNFESPNNEVIEFTISDHEGVIFYHHQFHDQKVNKKFLFTELDNHRVNLILTFKTRSGTTVQEITIGQ